MKQRNVWISSVICAIILSQTTACAQSQLSPAGNPGTERQGGIEHRPRVLARGRLDCPLNPVASLHGDADDAGRYFAVAVKCREGRYFQDYVEIVDIRGGGRSEHHRSDPQFYFLPDGRLLSGGYVSSLLTDEHPGNIRFRTWTPPFSGEAEESFHYAPPGHYGGPSLWSLSPEGQRVAAFWPSRIDVGRVGMVQVFDVSRSEIFETHVLSASDMGWMAHPDRFRAHGGVWLSATDFLYEGSGVHAGNPDLHGALATGPGRAIINLDTGERVDDSSYSGLSNPRLGYSIATAWDEAANVDVGRLYEVLESGVFVLTGGVDAQPEAPDQFEYHYELQFRSTDEFRFLGGVSIAGDPARGSHPRTVASFDFSPDGSFAYVVKRAGRLEIYRIHPWARVADLSIQNMGVDFAWQVITLPQAGQFLLIGDRRWALVDLDIE